MKKTGHHNFHLNFRYKKAFLILPKMDYKPVQSMVLPDPAAVISMV
jgi:hypothetical protein